MIPKTIHYCWFGNNPLPELAQKCINSWGKYCPNYQIIKWDEYNYDINSCTYTKEAYEAKKWAFVSDYARLDILYRYGGIYLDTDVELVKSLDDLLENEAYAGMEDYDAVATGLGMGANKGSKFIKELIDVYRDLKFCNDNKYNTTTCVEYTTTLLLDKGFVKKNILQRLEGFTIYPTEYFCPIKPGYRKAKVTLNTYSIHHYSSSWYQTNEIKKKIKYRLIPAKKLLKRFINNFFGKGTWQNFKKLTCKF